MRKFFVAVGLVLATTALATPAVASEQGGKTVWVPVDGTLPDVCGEAVQFSGRMYFTEHRVVDPAGHDHATGHVRVVASGVGLTTGTRYRLTSATQDTSTYRPADAPAGAAITTVFTARYVSAGPAENSTMTVVYHITMTPDGEVIVERDPDFVAECR